MNNYIISGKNGNKVRYIFISYCRIDSSVAKKLLIKLKEFGLNCFFDVETIQLGSNYADTLQSVILESQYIIYIYGENSEDNIWQRRELDLALESGKNVISLFINPCDEGVVQSILKKKTICHTSVDDVYNNIRKEISYISETEHFSLYKKSNEPKTYHPPKGRKKRYILLAVVTLFIACLFAPFYYMSSPNSVEPDMCPIPPCQTENNINSICVFEILDRDTAYISFKADDKSDVKDKYIAQYTRRSYDWVVIFSLASLILVAILMYIVKLCKKRKILNYQVM